MVPARLEELLDALREVGVVDVVARQALQQRVQSRLDGPAKGGDFSLWGRCVRTPGFRGDPHCCRDGAAISAKIISPLSSRSVQSGFLGRLEPQILLRDAIISANISKHLSG